MLELRSPESQATTVAQVSGTAPNAVIVCHGGHEIRPAGPPLNVARVDHPSEIEKLRASGFPFVPENEAAINAQIERFERDEALHAEAKWKPQGDGKVAIGLKIGSGLTWPSWEMRNGHAVLVDSFDNVIAPPGPLTVAEIEHPRDVARLRACGYEITNGATVDAMVERWHAEHPQAPKPWTELR